METTPHQNVTFPSAGGQAHGYLALPATGRGPGVIAIQEWWGLADHIRDVADRLAAEGFVALAADQGERIGAAVPFYGVAQGLPDTCHGVRAAVQGHYGREDTSYPVEKAEALEEQLRRESSAPVVEFHYYDAPHAFHNDRNRPNHRPDAAAAAWARAVAFLGKHVR